MQIKRTTPRFQVSQKPSPQVSEKQAEETPKDSFVSRNSENLVGLAGLTGMVGAGAMVASHAPVSLSGWEGAGVGLIAGAVTGAAAGVTVGAAFLKLNPLDPANEKEKYTALTLGAGGFVGGLVGGLTGAISGFCGTQSWLVAPATVFGGAGAAGLADAGVKAWTK